MQNPKNFSFSSDYPMPYFIYKTSTSVTASSKGTATVTIAHGLPFTPLVVGQWSPTDKFEITHDITSSAPADGTYCWVFADGTNIYIRQFNGLSQTNTIYVRVWAYPTPDYNGHLDAISDETSFNFSSDYNYLGVYQAGVIDGDNQVHVIPHGLGYVPQCKVWRGGSFGIDGGSSVKAIAPVSSLYWTSDPAPMCVVDKENLTIGMVSTYDAKAYYHIYTSEA